MSDSRLTQVHAQFASSVMRIVVDELKQTPAPWQQLREEQQDSTLTRIRNKVDETLRAGIAYVLAAGFKHVEVGVESMSCKTSAKLTVSLFDPHALHEVVDSLGRKVVLVLIDPAIYSEGLDAFVADADQPELPLEHDERPADQVDPEAGQLPLGETVTERSGIPARVREA